MKSQKVLVRRYLRRHPKMSERVVRSAIKTLERLGEADNLKYACTIHISPEDCVSDECASQVKPIHGFRRGTCTLINIEHRDAIDEVESVATLQHEAEHARDIAKNGIDGVDQKHEIRAHESTIRFLRRWRARERSAAKRKRIDEVISEEQRSIRTIRSSGA